jgi:hypothetical protein
MLGHNKPVKLRYAHICETTILGHNGNISIINAFDSVYFPQLPGQITKFSFTGGFEVERDDAGRLFIITIRLVDPNGHLLNELNGELNIEPQLGELPFHNLGWCLDGQVVQEYGRYEMEVGIDGQNACVIPILVKRTDGAG